MRGSCESSQKKTEIGPEKAPGTPQPAARLWQQQQQEQQQQQQQQQQQRDKVVGTDTSAPHLLEATGAQQLVLRCSVRQLQARPVFSLHPHRGTCEVPVAFPDSIAASPWHCDRARLRQELARRLTAMGPSRGKGQEKNVG